MLFMLLISAITVYIAFKQNELPPAQISIVEPTIEKQAETESEPVSYSQYYYVPPKRSEVKTEVERWIRSNPQDWNNK